MSLRGLTAIFTVCALSLFAACATSDNVSEQGQEVVSTDLTAYTQGQNIVVTFSNMQGHATDWISIARPGDSAQTYYDWKYTGGGTSGTVTFTMPTVPVGTYEARAFYDWANTASYTIQQTSAPFMITGNTVTLTPTQMTYALGQPVVINYTGFSGAASDWIAIYAPGAPDGNYIDWQFTGGGTSGNKTFNNLPSGIWEARYHPNWNATHSLLSAGTSPPFQVSSQPTITTDFASYGIGQTVTASWTGLPGNMLDYVAVSAAGSPASSTVQRFYTNGATSGSQQFVGLPAGSYEARAYLNDTTTILATYAFTVTGASVATDKANYDAADTVTVTYAGLPGNATDWIAIAAAGSADSQYVAFVYTNGQTMGTAQFSGLPSGNYEARAYINNTFTVLARSATFTVGATCTVGPAPVFSGLQTGELTIPADQFEAVAPLTVALDRSFLLMSVREREQSPQHGAISCTLHDADAANNIVAGITCKRHVNSTDTAGSNGTVTIKWSVVTFTSGVSVQRGVAFTYPTNPTTVTLTTIDPASSFVLLGGVYANGTAWGNNEFTRARITGATSLEIAQNIVGAEVPWQVVQMTGAQVSRGGATLASGATTASVTIPQAPSGSFVLASYTADNAQSIGANALMVQATLDATSIAFDRGAGGAAIDVAWELVSLPFATRHGTASFGAGVGAGSASVPGISPSSSVAIGSSQSVLGQSVGSTTFSGTDIVGEATATFTVAADSVSFSRSSTTATATIPWTVLDFAHNCAGL